MNQHVIWHNHEFLDYSHAKTHLHAHALHYGTAVFEGIRAYETPNGTKIFRAKDHYDRLKNSAKIYLMPYEYSTDELIKITHELLEKNALKSAYIRPLCFYGEGMLGLLPRTSQLELMISAWEWGAYLGEEGVKNGVRCCISSWQRPSTNALPNQAKCSANYANSYLAKKEAIQNGFDEAIMLNDSGLVAEGPGANLFVIKNGKCFTPKGSDSVLDGITADSVKSLLKNELGCEVIETSLTRDFLFLADELFFTGTAAEITPIREINSRCIGSGKPGPITQQVQTLYQDLVHGKLANYQHWLD